MSQKAVVILSSGGIDSTTAMAIVKNQGYEIISLSLDYGQRNRYELECSKKVAAFYKVKEHVIISLNLRQIGGSALTSEIEVPKNRSEVELNEDIPVTYVPARNLIFLSVAVALAEARKITNIFIGVNAVDFSGYPDCRPAFIQSFEATANLGTRCGVQGKEHIRIHTPLIHLSKRQIIEKGLELGVNFELTSSCYDPQSGGKPCGSCDSCLIRQKGFKELDKEDPCRSG